jgi:hypothetical protein
MTKSPSLVAVATGEWVPSGEGTRCRGRATDAPVASWRDIDTQLEARFTPRRIAGLRAAGVLALGEVLTPSRSSRGLVERIVFVAAVTHGFLLDAAADLVDDLGAQRHHMKGAD